MRGFIILALTLAATPPAMAQPYDGTYQLDQCAVPDPLTQIEISGFDVTYYESACTMTNPVPVRDMDEAFLFDAVCSGEGQTWTERVFMMATAEGGMLQVRRGYAYTYMPCP